jgi:hypothetical protein
MLPRLPESDLDLWWLRLEGEIHATLAQQYIWTVMGRQRPSVNTVIVSSASFSGLK